MENKAKLIGLLSIALLIFTVAAIAISPPAFASKGQVVITDVSGKPVDLVKAGDTIYITVNDPDENRDSDEVELIYRDWLDNELGENNVPAVKLVDPNTGDYEDSVGVLTLYETGPNTGIFRSQGIPVAPLSTGASPTPNNGILEVYDNDTIYVTYRDPSDRTDIDIDLAKITHTAATIKITDANGNEVPLFNVGQDLFVTLTDPDENTDPNTIQVINDVILENPRLALAGEPKAQLRLTLVETGPNTGVFRNVDGVLLYDYLGTVPQSAKGMMLPVRDKDTIVVYYRSPVGGKITPPAPAGTRTDCAQDASNSLKFCRTVPVKVKPGEEFTVTVTLTNIGSSTLNVPAFSDKLPSGFTPAAGAKLTNFAASLEPGKSITFTYGVKAGSATGTFTITGTAKATGISSFTLASTIEVAEASASGMSVSSVTAKVIAQGTATKSDGIEFTRVVPDQVAPGTTFYVTVRITNKTNKTLSLVAYKDSLPGGFTPASVSNFEQSLAPGATKEWTYKATAPATPGTYTITGKARAIGMNPVQLDSKIVVSAAPVIGPGLADPNDPSDFTLDTADVAEPNPSVVAFTDENGKEKSEFRIGEDFFITVRDADANIDSDRVEKVNVRVVDVNGGVEELELVETGTNTGVFRNPEYIRIEAGNPADDKPNDGRIIVHNRDHLYVEYQDNVVSTLDAYDIAFAMADISDTEVYDGKGTDNVVFTSDAKNPVSQYKVGEDLFLMVTDPDQNQNDTLIDVIKARVVDLHTGDYEDISLEETGPNTGVFFSKAGLPLRRPAEGFSAGNRNDGVLQVEDRDRIYAYYQDPSNGGDFGAVWADILPRPITPTTTPSTTRFTDSQGRDVARYVVGDNVYVTVEDQDENRTAGVVDTIKGAVVVVNQRTGAKVTVDLTETGPDTGIFISEPITTGPAGSGAMLEVEPGDTLKATYTDPDDPSDFSSDDVAIESAELVVTGYVSQPNPMVTTTTFKVIGQGVEKVHVWVWDLAGKLVYDSGEVAGASLSWNGADLAGDSLANGVYLFVVQAIGKNKSETSNVMKLVILKH